jgi:hypothetical protein
MELLPLPDLTVLALREQSVSALTQRAIQLVITCLQEVCAGVADDCDADLRHDDSTSEGQLRWRRCRNYAKKLLDTKAVEGLEDAVADVSDNALKIRIDDVAVSFYSSRNGIDHPDLGGSSKTKKAIVTEMQLQLDGVGVADTPNNLVVLYEADRDGLAAAAVGMLRTETEWAWRFAAFSRAGLAMAGELGCTAWSTEPTYEDEPEAELPPLEILGHEEAEQGAETGEQG